MLQIKDNSMCSGCHACASICPKNCISMIPDEEGFLYPKVDTCLCIDCGKCEKACQAINPITSTALPKAYGAYNTSLETRTHSSSGGVFSLIAEYILDLGGAVFGAAFDNKLNVIHICVEDKKDIAKLRGSKYVQSTIGTAFTECKKILEQDRYVLFTGTPCQIDGLLHYLGKNYDKLYTQDIICHGVPSPLVWHKYLDYISTLNNTEIDFEKTPSFRDKTMK